MRLWFAHSSEVTIYRQLVTQVALAVLCDSYTADLPTLPAKPHLIVFPPLADSVQGQLRDR